MTDDEEDHSTQTEDALAENSIDPPDEFFHTTPAELNLGVGLANQRRRITTPQASRRPQNYCTKSQIPWDQINQVIKLDVQGRNHYHYKTVITVHFHEPMCPVVHDMTPRINGRIPQHNQIPIWLRNTDVQIPGFMIYMCMCTLCQNRYHDANPTHASRHLWAFVVHPLNTRINPVVQIINWLCVKTPIMAGYTKNRGRLRIVPEYAQGHSFYRELFRYTRSPDPTFRGATVYYLPRTTEWINNDPTIVDPVLPNAIHLGNQPFTAGPPG